MRKLILAVFLLAALGYGQAPVSPDSVPPTEQPVVNGRPGSGPLGCPDGYVLWLNNIDDDGVAHFERADGPGEYYAPPPALQKKHIFSCWKTGVQPK